MRQCVTCVPSRGGALVRWFGRTCSRHRTLILHHWHVSASGSTSTSSCNFRSIFIVALKEYERKTKTDIHLLHPPTTPLHSCRSSSDILVLLHDKVDKLDHSKCHSERLSSWLNPTINVLYAFSTALGDEVGLVSIGPLAHCLPLPVFVAVTPSRKYN